MRIGLRVPGGRFALTALLAAFLAVFPPVPNRTAAQQLPEPRAENPTSPALEARPSESRRLVDLIEDRATRHGMIPRISPPASTPSPGSVADTETPIEAAVDGSGGPRGSPLIGERVVRGVTSLADNLVRGAQKDWNAARATARRLGGLARVDGEALKRVLPGLGILLAISVALVVLGNALTARWLSRFGRRDLSPGHRLMVTLAAILIDLAVVMAAVVIATVTMSALSAGDEQERALLTFVGAYLVAGLLIVALRAVLRPAAPSLRPLPMDDATALYWTRHLTVIITLVTFGEVLARPLLSAVATPITAQATVVTVNTFAVLYMMALVFLNRRAPVEYFEHRAAEDGENVSLAIAAAVMPRWHLVALGFLAFLLHQTLTSGEAGLPVLIATAQIAAALTAGLVAMALLSRLAEGGVRVSSSVRRTLPTMEGRLNAFVPPFLRLLRWVIFALWVGFVLQMAGTLALWDWAEAQLGIDLIGTTTSLVIVALGGFFAWLLVSSWVDFRLEPRAGQSASARERTLLTLLRNAALIAILLVGLAVALSQIGVSVTPLLASAGVIGLAISFGSQKLVQDIITGIFIQFENVINVGDVVEAGGKIGAVEKLTIRSVSLRDVEGVLHMVPFSSVDLVSNHMKGYSFHVADINIAFREDIDEAKAAMLSAYDDLTEDSLMKLKLLGGIEWFGVQNIGDFSVVLRARIKTRPGEQWAVGRAYSELVKKRFDMLRIEIPVPQVTMWFGQRRDGTAPAAQVALNDAAVIEGQRLPAAPKATRQNIRPGGPTDADTEVPDAGDDR